MAIHVHQTVNVRPVHAVVPIVATPTDSQLDVPIVIRMAIAIRALLIIIYQIINVMHATSPRDQPHLPLAKLLLKNQMAVHVHQTVNVRPVHAVVQIVATPKDSQPGVPIVIRVAIAIRALLIIIDQVINVMHAVVVKPVHRDQPHLPLANLL